jgi:hypothetical protein
VNWFSQIYGKISVEVKNMSMVVTISNEVNLKKIKDFFGAKDESEAVEFALEKVVRDFEAKRTSDLPDNFFEELFAEKTTLTTGESIQAIIKERKESKF